jgi:hypothetical protein
MNVELKPRTILKCRVLPGVRFMDPVWFSASASGPAPFVLFGERRTKIGWFVPRDRALACAAALHRAGEQLQDPLLADVRARIDALDEPTWHRVVLSAKQPMFKPSFAELGLAIQELRVEIHGAENARAFCAGFAPFFVEA